MSNFKVQNNLLYKLKSHYLQLNDNDTPLPPPPTSLKVLDLLRGSVVLR